MIKHSIGEVEDWGKKSKKKQEVLVEMTKHMDSRGQLDEIIRR